jgi:outer membrane lipopolysaccharide assembly protein LptE/RlpB
MRRSGEWRVTSVEKRKACDQLSRFTHNLKLATNNCAPLAPTCALLLCLAMLAGCGYRVAGKSDALPKSIHVIAVPALENKTTSYRIEQRLTAATVHEFLTKTPYRVVSDPANGDAVLRGKVLSLEAVPLLFDTSTGRATTMLVTVKCEVSFEERDTGKILYRTNNFVFRNEYEIPNVVNPSTGQVNGATLAGFFEEQDPALDRLAQDFAARLVAAVTENF